MITWLLFVCSVPFLLVQAQTVTVDDILFEAPQNMSAPLGFNVSVTCRGNGTIVWVINGIQARTLERIEDFRAIGVFTNIDQVNESTTVIFTSDPPGNYIIVCRVEQGTILSGQLQISAPAYLSVFGIPELPTNLAITTQGTAFNLAWTPPLIRESENLTYAVTVQNRASGESRTTTALSTPFTFSESIGERDCQLYEFAIFSMNQVGLSTNGVIGSAVVPTAPKQIPSSGVVTTVSLSGAGPQATLVFEAPAPCSNYAITGYTVGYRAFSDPNDLSVPQEQRRNIPFTRSQPQTGSDMIMLGTSDGLTVDRLVLVEITAMNSAGGTESEEITFRTTSTQSASVTIDDSYIGTVTCNFASGSTVHGCVVSFTQVDSNGNETFLFSRNIMRGVNQQMGTINDVVFNEVPDGSEIVSTVRDWQSDGSVGLVSAPASVVGPFTPTSQPPSTTPTASPTTSTSTIPSTTLFTITAPPTPLSQETLYIIIGAGAGGILLLLVLVILIACCICCCTSKRYKKTVYTTDQRTMDELSGNQAYGGIQLTGANGVDSRTRNNTYIANENGDSTVSGMGPTYETIEDARKKTLEQKASNPIYATTNNGSQANIVQGSTTNLVPNPVYADSSNQNPAVSALNPIYSGVGNTTPGTPATPATPVPGGQPPHHNPGFPYVSDSPLTPHHGPLPPANGTPSRPNGGPPHTQSSGFLNHSESGDVVPPYADPAYAYAEVRGYQGARVRNAVSSSSDQEKATPFRRNESYGMLTADASPLTTSPPPPPPLQDTQLN